MGESDQEYKRGGALQVKYSEYFGAKRRLSLKNENIRYDITDDHFVQQMNITTIKSLIKWKLYTKDT